MRGCNGVGNKTSQSRPETPDYLELRSGPGQHVVIFPGGLPFHQRQGARMLDVILIPEGETCRTFDLGLALDRPSPLQTALGLVTPVPLVATAQGPPHVGASGWLFHCDNPNLLLTTLRPAADGVDAVVARFLEVGGQGGQAELRCVRDPKRALLLDARGTGLHDLPLKGDAVQLDVMRNDLLLGCVIFQLTGCFAQKMSVGWLMCGSEQAGVGVRCPVPEGHEHVTRLCN